MDSSFDGADFVYSRSRASSSSRSSQSTSRVPSCSRPNPSNLFSYVNSHFPLTFSPSSNPHNSSPVFYRSAGTSPDLSNFHVSSAPSSSPSISSSSNSLQSKPALYHSVDDTSPDPSNFNLSSAPFLSRPVSVHTTPSTRDSLDAPSSTSFSAHSLGFNTQYSHSEICRPRNQLFLNALCRLFLNNTPISEEAREHLESFYVTEDEFTQLVVDKELEDWRYISLLDNKIVFDECTNPRQGEIITEITAQIRDQDRAAGSLFIGGTGNRITLSIHDLYEDVTLTPGTSNKALDGHWQLSPTRIPPQFLNSRNGLIAPALVLEVAVSNDSMPILTQIDLGRYFAAGTHGFG